MANIIRQILLLTGLSIFPLLTIASDITTPNNEWRLKIEKETVSVYYRTLASGNIEFKGITRLKAPLASFVALMQDVDAMPDWVYNVERAEVLNKISDIEAYSYVINTTPFPFSKRDSIVHTLITQDPKSLAVTISGEGVPDYLPEKPDYIRIMLVKSFWKFTPLDNGEVEVIFQGLGEPGGNILASVSHSSLFQWISKKFLWELPMDTLVNMKEKIKEKKYFEKRFGFIKEKNQFTYE